jgi:hypothetical protein
VKLHTPSNINPDVLQKSKTDIDSVNNYMDSIKGTVVSIKTICSGQPRPYADSVYEAVIFCHQPNSLTTNAPNLRVIDSEQAKAIARIFVHHWDDTPANWASSRLSFIRPEPNPCGIEEHKSHTDRGLHSCWRVQVISPFTD